MMCFAPRATQYPTMACRQLVKNRVALPCTRTRTLDRAERRTSTPSRLGCTSARSTLRCRAFGSCRPPNPRCRRRDGLLATRPARPMLRSGDLRRLRRFFRRSRSWEESLKPCSCASLAGRDGEGRGSPAWLVSPVAHKRCRSRGRVWWQWMASASLRSLGWRVPCCNFYQGQVLALLLLFRSVASPIRQGCTL